MGIEALGYIGVRAKDVGDWASYGENFLGLQRIDKSRSSLAFRMDDRKQRLVVDADGGQGIAFFGWEVADAAALDAVAARIEAAGTKVARGSPSTIPAATGSKSSTARRPRPIRSSPAATFPASAPARSVWATWSCISNASPR